MFSSRSFKILARFGVLATAFGLAACDDDGSLAHRSLAPIPSETLALMERRIYRWHCGCNHARMMEVLGPTMRQDPKVLFGDGEKLEIRCPRCGARHAVTREAMEAFVADVK